MDLGNFSVSLNVKDLQASRAFYEKLGFSVFAGEEQQGWLILKNGSTNLGLFQGMFEKNVLTFNPGWNEKAEEVPKYTDVRDIQDMLKSAGIALASEADPESTGPASCMVVDPDGNPILIDQHI